MEPPIDPAAGRRYNRFSRYLRQRFGTRVQKVSLDAGFGCPHRDGGRGTGGCIYCEVREFSPALADPTVPLEAQLCSGIEAQRKRYKAGRFIAYFQAYSNTHGSVDELRSAYDVVRGFPEVMGLSIGTRPDCIDPDRLDLIESYADDGYLVWIEYGLQSACDRTLERINRGHTVAQFVEAVEMSRGRPIEICVHVILGLPGETAPEMLATAELLARLPVHGIKLHNLHVVKGTRLAEEYEAGRYRPPEQGEYVRVACDFIERLPAEVTVQRLAALAPLDSLLAPAWAADNRRIVEAIEAELESRGSYQGTRTRGGPSK